MEATMKASILIELLRLGQALTKNPDAEVTIEGGFNPKTIEVQEDDTLVIKFYVLNA
jgi:hypothetical protein